MATNKVLKTFGIGATPSQTTTTWNIPAQQVTVLDATNPRAVRNLVVSNQGIRCVRGTTAAGILMADLFAALITLEPSLAYPPFFTTNPSSVSVAYGDSTSFTIVASSEVSVTYQWQVSTDAGANWSNLANAGVYSNVTTASMSISSVNGLNGYQYRCVATNSSGSGTSSAATLTVVPAISAQPSNSSVTHPAPASFSVTASGTATLTYLWYVSTDGGTTYAALTNTGVYTNTTTSTMNISDSTGLNGYKYRVVVTDGNNQSTTSNAATLTVA